MHNGFREIKIGFGNYAKIKLSFGPKNGYKVINGKYAVVMNLLLHMQDEDLKLFEMILGRIKNAVLLCSTENQIRRTFRTNLLLTTGSDDVILVA